MRRHAAGRGGPNKGKLGLTAVLCLFVTGSRNPPALPLTAGLSLGKKMAKIETKK